MNILEKIKRKKEKIDFNKKWREINSNNYTFPANIFDTKNVHIGNYSYGVINVSSDTNNKLIIGNYCSIAENVKFLLGLDHPTNLVSTYPFKSYFMNGIDAISKGDIIVDDDVWIGYGAIILSGVHISQGAIIAAGAVVTKDVPSYAIVGGVPANILKYRFSKEIIQELLKIDYENLNPQIILKNKKIVYQKIESVEQAKELVQRLQNSK
ncbi:CatB-related O-acetyltransferase [Limosilactobacillus fermentum]|uniref:CatB-related O-acetyltransferase n=1 Tax=Limosilactobacillus fermentum TaxID=1613 RepID=UPI0034D7488A